MAVQEKNAEVGKLTWFYREAEPDSPRDKPPVLLLHGLVAQSYSWREVLKALEDQGFRAIAPDWIGSGFSIKPDRRDFAYTPDAFISALDDFLNSLNLSQISLVAQGFLGSVGVQYALRHPERVDRLAILNTPLQSTDKLPWKMKQLGVPLMGDMMTQDPLLVDRTLEGGGGYRVEDADLDVYRRPFLKSSDAGRALFATVQNLKLKDVTAEIEAGLAQWKQPLLLGWGDRDPWLPVAQAKALAQRLSGVDLVTWEEVGHYPQEDWPEKVSETLINFLRRQA
ncbi:MULTISPECIES: alpha/beta fold hydrolase [unclassified Leptolyngbya]|uniref:alpha/beta fold hydrolase n=1 Tax=unclassified Leptolyngbya TaxID=2650499 RepID=UPI001681E92C|nr:alpha/beta fold hydrolase [Leptolyngbya sp. FACHB-8]MBD2156535.1 alpha/beta fold hydrolase [Leptolyngbya sp. FACHB-16]